MTTKELMEIVARNHGQIVGELEWEIESCCLGEGKIPMSAENTSSPPRMIPRTIQFRKR